MDPHTGRIYPSVDDARADGVTDPVPLGTDPEQAERIGAAQADLAAVRGFLDAFNAAERARLLGPKPKPVSAEERADAHRRRVAAQRRATQRRR